MAVLEHALCSFCLTPTRDVVKGLKTSICSDCVRLCREQLEQRRPLLRLVSSSSPDEEPTETRPASRLELELSAQPVAASALGRLLDRLDAPETPAPVALLLGPPGSGKSSALRLLAERLPGAVEHSLALRTSELEGLFADAAGRVLLLDDMETLRGSEHRRLAALLRGVGKASSPRSVFAALTLEVSPEPGREELAALVDGQLELAGGDVSVMLPVAAAQGVPAPLLAGFNSFVSFRELASEDLLELLHSRHEQLFAGLVESGYRVELGPQLEELVVHRALSLGGGAWGLRAVLAAMLSGLEARNREAATSRDTGQVDDRKRQSS